MFVEILVFVHACMRGITVVVHSCRRYELWFILVGGI